VGKPVAIKAAAGQQNVKKQPEKVTCGCGGRHKPIDGSAVGNLSWRNHVLTKKHQKWLQEQEQNETLLFRNSGVVARHKNDGPPAS